MIKVNAHTLNHLSGDANINVIATLEKNFGFNVTGQDFAGIKTFQDFYDLVITRMQEAK